MPRAAAGIAEPWHETMWEPDWRELLPDLKSEFQTPAAHNHNGTITFPFVGVKQGMLEIQMEYQQQIVLRPLNVQRGGHFFLSMDSALYDRQVPDRFTLVNPGRVVPESSCTSINADGAHAAQ